MNKLLNKIFALEQSRFIVVGVANTLIGMAAMFVAYNVFHFGYWISSACDYIVGSIFSYFANKYFTFKSEKKSKKEVARFVVNIVVCYFIAYGIAQPLMNLILGNMQLSVEIFEQISMIVGLGIFIVLNYFGQKYFVFKSEKRESV